MLATITGRAAPNLALRDFPSRFLNSASTRCRERLGASRHTGAEPLTPDHAARRHPVRPDRLTAIGANLD